jgi:predicted small lipoprotein YifL
MNPDTGSPMHRTLTTAVFSAVLAALAGCGQMGPLYMPAPSEPAEAQSVESPQPARQKAAAS